MVAPIENIRPIQGQPISRVSPRHEAGLVDFAAILDRLTKSQATQGEPSSPALSTIAEGDLLSNIEQATQSMQRANAFITSARAYYRAGGAMQSGQANDSTSAIDSRG